MKRDDVRDFVVLNWIYCDFWYVHVFSTWQDNDAYFSLPPSAAANGASLLAEIYKSSSPINVVLDSGAWATDMTNEELAQKWLGSRNDMEAAVYFGAGNRMLVVNKAGLVMPLALSPYETNLQKCLIYLDDVHTRGSDFRLSAGTRAAVTLGRGMQKDKLVQTCMRMRLLGNGHSVPLHG